MLGMLIAVVAIFSPMRGGDVNYRPMRVFDDAAWVWTANQGEDKFFRIRNDFESDGSPLKGTTTDGRTYPRSLVILFVEGLAALIRAGA